MVSEVRAAHLIREYRQEDATAIRSCIAELQDFERRIDGRLRPGDSIAAAYLEQLLGGCRACAGTILVAESSGAIAGFACILTRVPFEAIDDPPGEYALVTDLVVRDTFRRHGLGRALLRAAERHARDAGAAELRIGVLSGNHAAARLYRSMGFAPYFETLTKRFDPPAP